MFADLLQGGSGAAVPVQTSRHQVWGLLWDGDVLVPDWVTVADLLVRLEGDVPVEHVIEQDAETPDSETWGWVLTAANPLGRGVHAGPGELGVDLGLIIPAAGAKVYQLGSAWLQVNQDVFILKENFRNVDTR